MSVAMRLARGGAKKRPFYRIVVADKRAARDGKFIEKLGVYNPMLPKEGGNRVTLDTERAKYWLDQGAQPSARVLQFLADAGLTQKPDFGGKPQKSRKNADKKTRQELKAEAEAEAAQQAAEAASAPAEEAAAEEAAPVEAAASEEEAPKAE